MKTLHNLGPSPEHEQYRALLPQFWERVDEQGWPGGNRSVGVSCRRDQHPLKNAAKPMVDLSLHN
ncbi:MAG: hypothetical protein JWN03_3116 [Nocardia sp.]|uniref:hypothetical protein n=1 Tax=Nocardia sp. TaxID=1821 RepID=UPI002621AE75|nr:hypothetical protein [Nocardia sp.]MCU1642841.1 hypothetical protein [Nocardia sp.]